MTPRTPRPALLAVLALAATTALSGCAQLEQWNASPAPVQEPAAAPEPVATASGTPTPTPRPTPSDTPTPRPSATASQRPSPTPSETPTRTPSASATPSPSSTPTTTAEPAPEPTEAKPRSLRYGDSGADVRDLQRRLVDLGYWLGVRDGSFGSLTQQAVFAFQKSAGLERDGVVGPRTRKALDTGARPTARLKGSGIEIDLDRQLLMVVRKGKPALVLNTSTGSGEEYTSSSGRQAIATTPKGSFAVFREVDGEDDSALGELWRPKYFHRGYAVHGSPSIPPYPASHGCARVSDAAMDMIWDRGLMEVGTPVLVR